MEKLLYELENLLKNNEKYFTEKGLLKNKITELALKSDKDLLSILLNNRVVKNHFFTEIDINNEKTLVFDKEKFISFINNKEFLPGSYTSFKNQIGLKTINKLLVKESDDVSLVWPYKDCVLEGGQDFEDQKRNEIFYNETLSPDEIDRLFEPKVLTKANKIDHDGEHSVTEINPRDNLIIKGNNLIVLHCLEKKYRGKIKLIYLDPPYNTGNDSFNYNDKFNHSTWLTFMKNRLEIAKDLLRPDGIIFISIDNTEMAYLKVLCDEIYGRENFLTQIAYERSGVSGLGQGGSFLVNTHESILCYKKPDFSIINNNGEKPFSYNDMKRYSKIFIDPGERIEVTRFIAPSTKNHVIIYKHENEIINSISLKNYNTRKDIVFNEYLKYFPKIFRNTSIQSENKFQNKIISLCGQGLYSADYVVSRGRNKGKHITAYYYNKGVFAWLKDTAKLEDGKIIKTNKLSDFWSHDSIPKADLANEGGVKLRRGKKPENLLKRLLTLATKKNDIVMDFFSGSGTTCAVAHKMGRKYIGIEQLDYGENDSVFRLKNVIKGDKTGISKNVNWQGGGSFIYMELKEWNENYIKLIKNADTTDNLLEIYERMKKEAFFIYVIDFPNFDTEKFSELPLEDQKNILCECLDKNHLYVNLSEIDDATYNISDEDKKLNKLFYNQEI